MSARLEAIRELERIGDLAYPGYLEEAAVWVMVRGVAPGQQEEGVAVAPDASAQWRNALRSISGKSQERVSLLPDLVAMAPGPAAFASVEADGAIVGVSLGVVVEDHVGLFEMFVESRFRRRGAGRRMIDALCAWGRSHGASTAFLQVEEDNLPARAFYRALGFGDSHRYWYRVPPQDAVGRPARHARRFRRPGPREPGSVD